MKRNILLIVAALFMFLGNQSITAQAKMEKEVQSIDSKKSEESAKEKTKTLVRPLSLNKEQQEQVYKVLLKVEDKVAATSLDSKEQEVVQTKMNKYVMVKMKEILTEEQYKKYLDLAKKL